MKMQQNERKDKLRAGQEITGIDKLRKTSRNHKEQNVKIIVTATVVTANLLLF